MKYIVLFMFFLVCASDNPEVTTAAQESPSEPDIPCIIAENRQPRLERRRLIRYRRLLLSCVCCMKRK
jgi:hypothetical protein